MTKALTFSEVPPVKRSGRPPSRRHQNTVRQLLDHPGKWAIVHTGRSKASASSLAYHIRNGSSASYRPAGAFEATVRDKEVYARYVGPDGEHR